MTTKSMSGRTCVVTGATSGIGKETARALAMAGARTVIVGRSRQKCEAVAGELRSIPGGADVEYLVADLTSRDDVRRVAKEILDRCPQLHVLVNNAGAVFAKRQESVDGVELTWALNVLAPFLLTNLLLERLAASAPARIVNVSSAAHRWGRMNFEDLQRRKGYGGFRVYGQSKLALLLFTYELARRLDGSGVVVNAVHPGLVRTGFGMNNTAVYRAGVKFANFFGGLSPEEGARTVIYAAMSPEVDGVTGKYFSRGRPIKSSKASYDIEPSRRLWSVCEEMVGLGK